MRNFVIWFQHRSGSTHLISLLNSHPEILCKGEIFGCFPIGKLNEIESFQDGRAWNENIYRRVLNQFPGRAENPSDAQCVDEIEAFFLSKAKPPEFHGFKYKFPSQATVFPEINQWLRDRYSEIKVIVLHRNNYLRRALSVLNLERLQSLTEKANSRTAIKMPPTEFDVSEIIRLMRHYRSLESEFREWCEPFKRVHHVEYSDLVSNEIEIARQVQEFLGVAETRRLKSEVQKITPGNINELVLNLDELRSALKNNALDFE